MESPQTGIAAVCQEADVIKKNKECMKPAFVYMRLFMIEKTEKIKSVLNSSFLWCFKRI